MSQSEDEPGDYGYMSEKEEDEMSVISGMSGMSLQSQQDIMKALEQHAQTEKLKKKRQLSDQELMQECAKEWNESREVAWFLWNGAKERLRIFTNDSQLNVEQKEKILEKIITGCSDLNDLINKNKILNLWNDNDDPLQWIKQWKETKSIVVSRSNKLFEGQKGLPKFKEIIAKQVRDIDVDEILAPSKDYISQILDKLNVKPSGEKILNIGEVIIEKPKNVMDDLSNAMNQLRVEKEYTVDDLINDVQNKLQFIIDDNDKQKIKQNVKGLVSVEELIKDISTKAAIDNVGKKVPFFKEITGNDSPIKIYGTIHPEEMRFIEPYKDPHFTFLGTKIEYWVPKVHFKTSLDVFNEKKEILRKISKGNVVYIKYQSVKVKNGDKTFEVYYIRKFVDFNDFLKSWQETYVRKYFELGEKIINLVNTEENPWKQLNIYVIRRKYYRYKIKDIKLYFLEEMKKERKNVLEETKLCDYASDEVVTLLLSEDIPLVEQELWNYIENITDSSGQASKEALEGLRKTFKEYYPKLFPKKEEEEPEPKKRRMKFSSKKKMLNRRKR